MTLVLAAVQAVQASPEALASGGGSGISIVLLMIVGVLLIFLETMVPGGFLGALGGAFILFAVVLALVHHGSTTAMVVLSLGVVAAIVAVAIGWRRLPHSKLGQKMILTPSPGHNPGPVTEEQRAKAAVHPGDRGMSLTDLRPAGSAKVGEWRLDVVTRGEYVVSGTPIEVMAIDGTRVVVRAVSAPEG